MLLTEENGTVNGMTIDEFVQQYHIPLNEQQLSAVQETEGPVMILAVPGSGKTTVMVTRIGYMVMGLGIDPDSILALTYTVAGAGDLARRYESIFGAEEAARIRFSTINAFAMRVISFYGRSIGRTMYRVADEKQTTAILSAVYRRVEQGFPTESDTAAIRQEIAYIKNMCLDDDEIRDLEKESDYHIGELCRGYQAALKAERAMDFDDQLTAAYQILRTKPEVLRYFRERCRYVCVDEAQDSSKIQVMLFEILTSADGNLCEVGDEDQSIYGFRAAYPEALLSFEARHPGAKTLLMEENFRSTPEIVMAADRFIAKNRDRHPKTMHTARAHGKAVRRIELERRSAQYTYILKVAQGLMQEPGEAVQGLMQETGEAVQARLQETVQFQLTRESLAVETAVLYRNNESVIPLVDLLERNHVPFRLRSQDMTFFSNRVVQDVENILRFALNPSDHELFLQIYYKIGTYICKQDAMRFAEISREEGVPVLDGALNSGLLNAMTAGTVRGIRTLFKNMITMEPGRAISVIMETMGYSEYLERAGIDDGKLTILRAVARREKTIADFLYRMEDLHELMMNHENDPSCRLTLSTIHASKGLEYGRVFLMDVADGIFPDIVVRDYKKAGEADIRHYEEERRIFYVGMTRAREELCIFSFDKASIFADEVLGKRSKHEEKCAGARSEGRYEKGLNGQQGRGRDTRAVQRFPREHRPGYREFAEKIGAGMICRHRKYGECSVVDLAGDVLTLDIDGEERKFSLRFLYDNQQLEFY